MNLTSGHSWRNKSLEELENHVWGDHFTASTHLVKRCIELSKIPVGKYDLSDLRLMIGQQSGLSYLVPLAIEALQPNILVETEYYEGDLLSAILNIDTLFWKHHQDYWKQVNQLITGKRQLLERQEIATVKFDNAKSYTRS